MDSEFWVIARELGSTGVLIIFLYYWHIRATARDEDSQKTIDRLCSLLETCVDDCRDDGR